MVMRIALVAAILLAGTCQLQAQSAAKAEGFDARPFLSAMIELKRTADICDSFVNNAPASRLDGVDQFFAGLKQPLPQVLINDKTKASLGRFVKQQAAAICKVKLNHAFATFDAEAARYERGKPKGWPDAPKVQVAPWCSTADCSDVN